MKAVSAVILTAGLRSGEVVAACTMLGLVLAHFGDHRLDRASRTHDPPIGQRRSTTRPWVADGGLGIKLMLQTPWIGLGALGLLVLLSRIPGCPAVPTCSEPLPQ